MLFSVHGSLTATHFSTYNVWCRHFTPRTNLENPITTRGTRNDAGYNYDRGQWVKLYESAMRGQKVVRKKVPVSHPITLHPRRPFYI